MTSISWRPVLLISLLAILLSLSAAGQDTEQPKTFGDYIVQQSIEVGYRTTDVSGATYPCAAGNGAVGSTADCVDEGLYNTFVNLHSGPRVLEQSFSMRAPAAKGGLFDDLFASSFGWGGDPNNAARVRVKKQGVYTFNGTFRRDQYFWDYNLFANPLNPMPAATSGVVPATNAFVPFPDAPFASPHTFMTRHRMTDLGLTIKPQSAISLRLGYSRNRQEGPSFSTNEEGAFPLLLQANNTYTNQYQVGLDFRVLPKTTFSFDQFYQTFKSDTQWGLGATPFLTTNGLLVDFGTAWDLANNAPCRSPQTPFNAARLANPKCDVYQSLNRFNPWRTHTPTEQFSLQSQAIKHVELNARFSYSNTHLDTPFFDSFQGNISRTGKQFGITDATGIGKRVSVNADFGATIHITERTRFLYSFRFLNWRAPRVLNVFTAETDAAGVGAVATPGLFTTASTSVLTTFMADDSKWHQFELEHDFTHAFGARIGYRYRSSAVREGDADFDADTGLIATPFEVEDVDIHEHSALVGLWFRPNEKFRANFDGELSTADNWEFRIQPRRQLQYRLRANYKPVRWAILSAVGNFLEQRNNVQEIRFNGHTRSAGVTATFLPTNTNNYAFDFSYNYNNIYSGSFVCFQETPVSKTPPTSFPSQGICATGNPDLGSTAGPALNREVYGIYANQVHFADATFMFKPVSRVKVNLGYSVVGSFGDTTIFNPLQPWGSLKSNWHRPLAGIELEFVKNWFAKAGWNYYDYNEKDGSGPTRPRDFHANVTTVSLKYAF